MKDELDVLFDKYNVCIRVRNVLRSNRINSISKLIGLTENIIFRFRGAGRKTVIEIRDLVFKVTIDTNPDSLERLPDSIKCLIQFEVYRLTELFKKEFYEDIKEKLDM